MKYRFFVADAAISTFGAASQRERLQLADYFAHLAEFPANYDHAWDIAGFEYCAKRFGRWSITYRVDGPAKQVLIIEIKKLSLR